MAQIIPFQGLRPLPQYAEQVASPPYDVCSVSEARQQASDPFHFFYITRSEIDLPDNTDVHSAAVYEKAKENLDAMIAAGVLKQDERDCYYIYRLVMQGREQTGLLCASSIDDYKNGIIKKHEFTRPEKEQDRIDHMKTVKAQTGVVFLAYRNVKEIDELISNWKTTHPAENDFTAEDGVRHTVWVVDDPEVTKQITALFQDKVPATYIADGHHRAASAARVAADLGTQAASFFLTAIFPESDLKILDYNRVVKDLNGLSPEQFLEKLHQNFTVQPKGKDAFKPGQKNEFGLYLNGIWYQLTAHPELSSSEDPIAALDVSILQDKILSEILDIHDPRTDKRVDFVGGIRGLAELEKRVDHGGMAAAFSCYPVQLNELFRVADSGQVMPPKSTWFEPKTRDGLVIYRL